MKEEIRLLQADIRDDLRAIADAYHTLHGVNKDLVQADATIVAAYYLNVLYGLFENLFTRIAAAFGNQIQDTTQWHTQLLRRMTLDVAEVRPHVISAEAYHCLDELRRFRHVFRNAYMLSFDPTRLALVLENAQRLETLYQAEINTFLGFLDELAIKEGKK
jgi:hypothetical protein